MLPSLSGARMIPAKVLLPGGTLAYPPEKQAKMTSGRHIRLCVAYLPWLPPAVKNPQYITFTLCGLTSPLQEELGMESHTDSYSCCR